MINGSGTQLLIDALRGNDTEEILHNLGQNIRNLLLEKRSKDHMEIELMMKNMIGLVIFKGEPQVEHCSS